VSREFADRDLESTVEDEVCAWAENNGWLVRKMGYTGRRGCPDRFLFGYGRIMMIEFKRPNGKLSANQRREHHRMRDAGLEVRVVEYAEDGIDILRSAMREPRG